MDYVAQLHEIPFSYLFKEKCRNCELPLTCGPVYVLNDLTSLCGRCHSLSANGEYRNFVYEKLSSLFLYPCRNWQNHCPAKLHWNESLEHEDSCGYIGCCSFCCCHPGAFFKGKRNFPRDETIKSVSIPDHLLDAITCAYCTGYLNCSPVYIQPNGQNVCDRCVNSNGIPPNCRRNEAYERLSQMIIFPCSFKANGCPERSKFGTFLRKHELTCSYNPHNQRISTPPVHQEPFEEQMDKKTRDLVTTGTGHQYWLTVGIKNGNEYSKELVNSLSKRQGRHFKKVDDIHNEMGRWNSDCESVSTNESISGVNSERNGVRTPESYEQPAYSQGRPHSAEVWNQNQYQDDFPARTSLRPRESYRNAANGGYFPVHPPHRLNDVFDSMESRPSIRESARANVDPLLITELKLRQDLIKRTHSIKTGVGDPKIPRQIR